VTKSSGKATFDPDRETQAHRGGFVDDPLLGDPKAIRGKWDYGTGARTQRDPSLRRPVDPSVGEAARPGNPVAFARFEPDAFPVHGPCFGARAQGELEVANAESTASAHKADAEANVAAPLFVVREPSGLLEEERSASLEA